MKSRRIATDALPDWPRLMRIGLAAAYCDVSAASFEKHFRPHVPPVHLGRSVRFDREQLDNRIKIIQDNADGIIDPQAALDSLDDDDEN